MFNIKTIISDGLAYGKAIRINRNESSITKCSMDLEEQQELIDDALNKALLELEELKTKLSDKDKDFIDIHKMLISDPMLKKDITKYIMDNNYTAGYAFSKVMDKYIKEFNEAPTTYLKERALDLEDIKKRVLRILSNKTDDDIKEDFILVIDELYPSILMTYPNIIGVISTKGGYTSHGAILCKSKEIPYVLVDSLDDIKGTIVIDTRKNIINDNPKEKDKRDYLLYKKNKDSFVISDFHQNFINILANVSSNIDIANVLKYKMDGIGLYRTELIFMNLDRPMSCEEQQKVYTDAVELLGNKPITFRTFDIGDDKQLSYIKTFKKGIDNYKNNPEIFETQIKALIASNIYGSMKIMFPMIETHEEFLYLKNWVLDIKKKMGDTNDLKIGMMLETKSALERIEEFKDVDFISLGTNDLTSELYHIKRDEMLNYKSFIADLIESLRRVASHCKKYDIYLSICGELAGVKNVVKRLYEIGLRNFSVSGASVRNLNQALLEETSK